MHEPVPSSSPRQWYVMVHPNPQWIETMLFRESRGQLRSRDSQAQPLAPFEFFVPFLSMRPDASDDLRSLFFRFVFIHTTADRLRAILSSDWNTRSRLRLYHYRDHSGTPIIISDAEQQALRDLILQHQLQVYFGLPIEQMSEMAVGDRVTLLLPGWENKMGRIERIRLRRGSVSMVVAVNILGQTKSIHFENLHEGDVVFSDRATQQLLTGSLLDNIEAQVITALSHYCCKATPEKLRRDLPMLRRLLLFATVDIDNADQQRRHSSLMLLAATLLDERDAIARYVPQLQQWLEAPSAPPSTASPAVTSAPTSAASPAVASAPSYPFVALSLFVATRDPRYRDAVKSYRKTHPDCPPAVGRIINLVRDLPTRKPPSPPHP